MTTPAPEDRDLGVFKLERELARARANGARATRELHALMGRELKQAEKALRRARAENRRLRRRARKAEGELAAIRQSRTWKARRRVLSATSRLRRS